MFVWSTGSMCPERSRFDHSCAVGGQESQVHLCGTSGWLIRRLGWVLIWDFAVKP